MGRLWSNDFGLRRRRRARNGTFDGEIPVLLWVKVKPRKLCLKKKKKKNMNQLALIIIVN